MSFPSPHLLRPSRRLAWALLLGGGISMAFAASDGEEDNYFDPLPKSEIAARKAAEREKAEKTEKAEKEKRLQAEREADARRRAEAAKAAAAAAAAQGAEAGKAEDESFFALPAPTPKTGPQHAEPSENIFADVAEAVLPSVVSVTRRRGGSGGGGLGSGVLAGPPGYVLTSNHVVEGEGALKVRLSDGRELEAERVAADAPTDVAVLRIRASQEVKAALRPIRMGNSDALRVGEWVSAIGSPYGLSETVTTGIVSAKGRRHSGLSEYGLLIQTDAAINPGNSGGALVNLKGELVGINTAIVSGSGGSQGIGFAIPSNLARKVMDDLLRDGKVSRGWLGVTVSDAAGASKRRGARVDAVAEGGPGEKAGLRRGDLIVGMEGKPVRGADDVLELASLARPGSLATLEVLRGKTRKEIDVRVGRRAAKPLATLASAGGGAGGAGRDKGEELDGRDSRKGQDGARLGMSVAAAQASLRKRYGLDPEDAGRLVITAVEKGGGADDADLRAGDIVLEADRKRMADVEALRAAVARAERRDGKVSLTVKRDGEVLRKTVRLVPGSV